jgi:hypothetical protein
MRDCFVAENSQYRRIKSLAYKKLKIALFAARARHLFFRGGLRKLLQRKKIVFVFLFRIRGGLEKICFLSRFFSNSKLHKYVAVNEKNSIQEGILNLDTISKISDVMFDVV